jgi:CRISPR/Cas system-associated exonuclease Cas4 (RecB family)
MTEKQHISASQIKTYMRCPKQWYFRYIEGLKIPPKGAPWNGTKIHETVDFNYSQKINTFQDKPIHSLIEYYDSIFDKERDDVDFER